MKLLRSLAHSLFGDYAIYRIFRCNTQDCERLVLPAGISVTRIEADELAASDDESLRALAGYAGEDAWGFLLSVAGIPATACWFWAGARYQRRNFWPLAEGEAKMVQITTAEHSRGRGYAPLLVESAVAEMGRLGFHTLYARIWHNNTPSLRVFKKAGWSEIALVAEVFPFGRRKPWRLVRRS